MTAAAFVVASLLVADPAACGGGTSSPRARSAGPARAGGFAQMAHTLLSTGVFAGAQLGVVFVSLEDGSTPYARNPDLPLIPASVAKLASSAAALEGLGPEFRFKTSFLISQRERGRRVLSALVWRGDGDPSISGRGRSSVYEVFELWGASLAALGVERVKRLVLDGRAFEPPATSPHWPADELSYWYAAQSSAISFNDNCVDLRFYPGAKVGGKARVELAPDFGYVYAVNRATTAAPGTRFTIDYRRKPGTNRVEFFGSIGATELVRSDYVAVHDPALYAAHTLRRVWETKGPAVGKIVDWAKAGLREEDLVELHSWESAPVSELLKVVNKNSQNLYAEQILKALGRHVEGRGSFEGGLAVVRRFLAKAGLSEHEHHLVDGSGLAEENRMTARGIAKILGSLKSSPLFAVYFDSLAVPGVDRAARDRMKGEPLATSMRVKRGTVQGARNLAGYLRSRGGRLYAFAVLVNGPALDRSAVDAATDELCLAALRQLP